LVIRNNTDGYSIIDVSTLSYESKFIAQGETVSILLQSNTDLTVSDFNNIEVSQRITPSGLEISRQIVAVN
jgi:hypothetical protein